MEMLLREFALVALLLVVVLLSGRFWDRTLLPAWPIASSQLCRVQAFCINRHLALLIFVYAATGQL